MEIEYHLPKQLIISGLNLTKEELQKPYFLNLTQFLSHENVLSREISEMVIFGGIIGELQNV